MRINSFGLQNFRLFGEKKQSIHLSDDKNIVIILGNNGTGKTSILDSLALSLAPYVDSFPNEGNGPRTKAFADNDIHLVDVNERAPFACVEAVIDGCPVRRVKKWKEAYGSEAPETSIKALKELAKRHFSSMVANSKLAEKMRTQYEEFAVEEILPIIAYYGTDRGQIYVPERKRNFRKVFNRWDCYSGALLAATDFKRFFSWFDLQEDEERRQHERDRNFRYKNKQLKFVKDASEIFIGDKFSNPRTETHPLRFVVNDCHDGKELRIEQLSDGYKMIIAMVADIASRMAEANPDMVNPLYAQGVVLIDEIDLHLHPLWQRKVLQQLHETFRYVQFIVTTHSPSIVLGAADIAQVLKLEDGKIINCDEDYRYYDVSQVLLSSMFDSVPTRTPRCEETLKKRDILLEKGSKISSKEKAKLVELDKEVSKFAFGESQESLQLKRDILNILSQEKANAKNKKK